MTTSQNKQILEHLKKGKRLTGLQALNKFGCIHLPRRIKDLKEAGHELEYQWVKTNNKRVKEWRLA